MPCTQLKDIIEATLAAAQIDPNSAMNRKAIMGKAQNYITNTIKALQRKVGVG